MRFFSFHGYYPEEQKTGTWFSVSVEIELPDSDKVVNLSDTLNYELVHARTAEIMSVPQKLIETVCQDIYSAMKELGKGNNVSAELKKVHPPLKNTSSTSYEISDFTRTNR